MAPMAAGPPARVPRSKAQASAWYHQLAPLQERVLDRLEARHRGAGVDLLRPERGERILELGPGTGRALTEIARRIGPQGRALGVELAWGMCQATADRLANEALADRAGVVAGDIAHLPLADGSQDAAFACFVLELIDTPELGTVLGEVRRVLGEEGRLVVVMLDRVPGDLPTRAYELLHGLFPTHLDCRPLPPVETMARGGFEVEAVRRMRHWGLPVAVFEARPADR